MLVEGAAVLPVAALLRRPPELAGRRVVAAITGSKIDAAA
jgi:threonine dehydratase